MERTICDILRDRNNQDAAVVSDALKKYTRRQDKNLNRLMKYAGLLRIEKMPDITELLRSKRSQVSCPKAGKVSDQGVSFRHENSYGTSLFSV